MITTTSSEEAARLIAEILRADIEIKDKICKFGIKLSAADDAVQNIYKSLDLQDIEKVIENLQNKSEYEETTLLDDNSYEVLVRWESRRPPFYVMPGRSLPFKMQDEDNGLTYNLGPASDEYFLFLIQKIKEIGDLKMISRPPYALRESASKGDEIDDDVLTLAKHFVGPKFITLQIKSTKNRNVTEFEKLADAYFFQLSYNLDQAILPQRYLDELLRLVRITRLRRASLNELEPPKRLYIPDLIHHYQLAIASENPALEFLSYYHVMEHFFESIFRDALIEQIRQLITQPDFSYKRNKDITKLIKTILDKQKTDDNDNIRFNEQEALRLTLQKYVLPSSLCNKIREYDDCLIAYYKTEKVEFCAGDTVNLETNDDQQIINLLSKRIYKTRNALVHSKDGEKGKFIPFRHDKILVREIPLMRFIAEIIIVESSKVMV